ncbi:hypothetical protein Tco_0857105 [Tanacetum coccineum]|uniref:Uncharacterized protein n=1 Tax=Tanacetum coccineum TaxID=301880 RepID=A0ABQ5B8D2_9ASTR
MAALKYKDDHNKIAYLGRERGCEDFTDILSYLDHSPLRYALTHDPPVVFDSLVKQFWATAVVRPNAAGSHDLVATIDGREGQPITLTPPMIAIACSMAMDDDGGDDVLLGIMLACQLKLMVVHPSCRHTCVTHYPPVLTIGGKPAPERQPVIPFSFNYHTWSQNGCPSPPVSLFYDWRPWPSVFCNIIPRDPSPDPASPPTPPASTFIFEELLVFGLEPRPVGPDNYLEPEALDNIISMEDDTTHDGFHVESPVRPDDAPTPTADAAGRAEDPALLTDLSAKLDRVKKLEKTVKQFRETRLVVDASAAEGDVDIQDDIDLAGLSRMTSTALGHDQPAVPFEEVEEQAEEEVPLRRKRSAYRRARTEFSTPAFEQFQANLSAGVLPHTAVPEPAGPSVAADKGKVPMPDLDIPAEFLAEDAQARKRFEEEQASERLVQRLRAEDLAQEDLPNVSEERAKELDDLMMRMTETDWLTLMMQVGSNPALARELLGADVNEENFIERMNAVKEKKKRALADLRYRALKGKPMKKSEVTQMMRNLVKNQWCAAHNGTITMKDVKAMNKQQLIEEYEYICRRLEKDRLLSAQYNLFRPKPAITEPPSKRQRVERVSSQPASVPAATTLPADDPDSAGGGSSNPAGLATPMAGSAASNNAGGAFGAIVTDSAVTTTAAMDSAGSHRKIGVSPFADSVAGPSPFLSSIAGGPSPSNVSTDQIPIAVLFESTSGDINEFFLESDEEEQIGMSRVVADPDSDDEVIAEIIFRGKSISGDGVVFVDKLPDDEIVDPRVKVETVSESASSPPRSRRKHLGVRSDDFLWDKPVEDFFSSESESDDDMENYIPPLPYGEFKDWEIVSCPPGNNYIHVYYQENRRRKYFTYLKELLPHVYREDLLLLRRRMNRRQFHPRIVRDVVVAGNFIIQTSGWLRQAYDFRCMHCSTNVLLAALMANSQERDPGSPLQTAFCCFFDVALHLISAVHRTSHVFIMRCCCLDVAATVSVACIIAVLLHSASQSLLREDLSRNLELTDQKPKIFVSAGRLKEEAVPADYVPAGHVLISADKI